MVTACSGGLSSGAARGGGPGLHRSEPRRFAFRSARAFIPQTGGIAVADQLCNDEADGGGYPAGEHRALLPFRSKMVDQTAASRLGPGPDWVRADGVVVHTWTASPQGRLRRRRSVYCFQH